MQSAPYTQSANSAPGPPSSHTSSERYRHVSVQTRLPGAGGEVIGEGGGGDGGGGDGGNGGGEGGGSKGEGPRAGRVEGEKGGVEMEAEG